MPAFTNDRRDRFSNVSARVSARYTLNDDDANVYVTSSTGFKSGAYPSLSPTTPITRPENIRAVEGGLKMPLAQGRMLLTEPLAQSLAVIALVGDEFGRRRHGCDAALGDLAIVEVSRGQEQAAFRVADSMELGVAPAFGAADTMSQGPPFSAAHAAVDFDATAVDEQPVRRIFGFRQRFCRTSRTLP